MKKILLLLFLFACAGYNATIEQAKISNSLFMNGFYGQTIASTETPFGEKKFSEIIANAGFEKTINDNFSFVFNLTNQNQFQNSTNFSDTSNYLRLNFGLKNRIIGNLSLKAELIYDIDLNLRPLKPYNQKYLYGIAKLIYDYKNFTLLTSLNSFSIAYNLHFISIAGGLYLRPDYDKPILNVGIGLRK